MTELQILPATDQERDTAAALMASSEPWTTLHVSLDTCRASTHDPAHHVFVAHDRDQLAGVIILHDKGLAGSPYVKSLIVAPAYRGQGVGSSLLAFAEDRYRTQVRNLFLCVSSFNTSAQKFYEQHGWVKVGELKDYVVEGYDEWILRKRLS